MLNFLSSCFIQLVNETSVTDFGIEIIQSQRLAVGQMNDFESGEETRFGYILRIKQKQETQHADKLRIHER